MKYERYEFVNGSAYKAAEGKDGITGDDMRVLKRVVKGSQKMESKVNRLDTVSIELVTQDGWQEVDVAVIVEEQDEYQRLHKALAALLPEQQTLIYAIYFKNISIRDYARQVGLSHTAIRKQLKKIYSALKINL